MNVSVTTHVNAPRDQVWNAMCDLEHAAERISAIKKLEVVTDGPVGIGTRFRETRIMFKREATEEMTITEWNPPSSYTVEANSCGAHFKTVISCEPAPQGGTNLTMATFVKPISFMAKLMTPLSKLMAGSFAKACKQDLDDIKRAVENAGAAQPA